MSSSVPFGNPGVFRNSGSASFSRRHSREVGPARVLAVERHPEAFNLALLQRLLLGRFFDQSELPRPFNEKVAATPGIAPLSHADQSRLIRMRTLDVSLPLVRLAT